MAIADCDKCKTHTTRQARQHLACGFEPPIRGALAWEHEGFEPMAEEIESPLCPGYTANLSEVVELSRAAFWARSGNLQTFCGGETPSENLLVGIEIYEGSRNQLEHHLMTSKKG